jgi:hypothetical protein
MWRFLLILGLVAAMPLPARAEMTAMIGRAKLHLPMPDGYCALDTDRARESTLFDFEQKSYHGRSRLLAMAADCGELEGFRLSHHPITRIVSFAVALRDGDPVRRPDDERAQYLDELAGMVAKVSNKDLSDANNQWWRNFNVSVDVKKFGVAGRDDSAIYLRAVRTIDARDKISIVSLSAATLAGGWELSASFYLHGDERSVPGLLEIAKHEAQLMVAANTPPPPPPVIEPPAPVVAPPPPEPATAGEALQQIASGIGRSEMLAIEVAMGVMGIAFLLLIFISPSRR